MLRGLLLVPSSRRLTTTTTMAAATSMAMRPAAIVPVEDRCALRIRSPRLQAVRTSKFRLPNGLEVFAVSDPGTPASGAAMTVETGSWRDEPDAQGTAHFLEHMLFLGTAKYPEEWAYDRYIRDHGGQLNAYTASDHTTYMFSITNEAYAGALDRFAPFFHQPLFNPDCVEREMNAVDEEFRKNISQDGWRQIHVLKELANPTHPFAFFNTGNLESMKLISQDRLHQWYREYYVATAMRLVMYGQQPIEWLQQRAAELFSPIPSLAHGSEELAAVRERHKVRIDQRIYPDTLGGSWIHVVPLKNLREISLVWELPAHLCALETHADSLAGFVLGHEGEGSLYNWLHQDDLIESLSAGASCAGGDNWTFEMSMGLTAKGLREWHTIVERALQAIHVFEQMPEFPEYVREELNQMARVGYEYQTRGSIFNTVTRFARQLREEALDTFPQRTVEITRLDQHRIRELWSHLVPETMHVKLVAPVAPDDDVKAFHKEKHMGAAYRVNRFTPAERDRLVRARSLPTAHVTFPAQNPFIPQKLKSLSPSELIPEPPVIVPDTVIKDERGHILVLPDRIFGNPVVNWVVCVHAPAIRGDDPVSAVRAELWSGMIREQLRVPTYPAVYAGLSFGLGAMATGVTFSLSGYTDKALDYWHFCLDKIASAQLGTESFHRVRDQLLRGLRNSLQDMPVSQALRTSVRMQYAKPVTVADRIHAAEASMTTLDDIRAFQREWFSQTYIEGILTGQSTAAVADKVFASVASHFQPAVAVGGLATKRPSLRRNLEVGCEIHESSDRVPGNAGVLMYDLGPATIENIVMSTLVATALSEPFSSELRTKQQTGYIVSTGSYVLENARALVYMTSQSSTVTAQGLMERYEAFLSGLLVEWQRNPSDIAQRFKTIRQSQETQLAQPYTNLGQLRSALEHLAFDRHGDYEERARALAYVRSLEIEDFMASVHSRLNTTFNTARTKIMFSGEPRTDIKAKL